MQAHNPSRGLIAARFVAALAAARGDPVRALAIAQGQAHRFRETPQVVAALKAAATDPLSTTMDSPLLREPGRDLAELARPLTIIGRLPGLRRVPFDVR